ncbi:MAG: pseudouridine synthase, partial [Caulobacteraceae bacterium]|nr:pseudouridine synthase [Caulobacteraceae bacterium]
MNSETDAVDDQDEALDPGETTLRVVEIDPAEAGERIDKVLASRVTDLSRARIQALIADGRVTAPRGPLDDPSARAQAGLYRIEVPAPVAAEPFPEAIPLTVLFEDQHLIVVDKPAGMAAHPGPGTASGTLVNALLHHCGASLSGIGGVARPGIVHRLDKDTSGVMVAAKTDAAHQGLTALFAAHDIERVYVALTRGSPKPAAGTIVTRIGRSPHDRKKMAVLRSGGREA